MTPPQRLEITAIAAGGDGVARQENLVVFVPRTAPGDVVDARVSVHGRWARGRVERLERGGPDRVEPPCPHYTVDRCGGCQLQHLAYPAQLEAKRTIVGDALQRIGGRPVPVPPVRASERPWRYRRKLTLAMRWDGDGWIMGLHPFDAPGRIFDLDDCPITDERVVAVWADIRRAAALLPRSRVLRGAVRLLGEEDGAVFVLEGGRRWPTSGRFFERLPQLAAVWWVPDGGERQLLHDRRTSPQPGASFAQVNPEVAAELRAHVAARILAHSPATVVDAYAGAGDLASALAALGVRVTAIELDAEAAAYCAGRLPAESRTLVGRVEDLLPEALPADVVLLNPPRAGVDARVTEALLAGPRPRAIIYVSCNPATLARDLARLPGYAVASLAPFDMFPQTAHVETVCELIAEAE
ncbi:MAG TPA: class I SAM-dependent RNA methyltransferase [Gemmatimonadaceae bacterium]|nr:class I SAM-dependent RNA methyltransferase [Gemmatimonadaceae bacterium]